MLHKKSQFCCCSNWADFFPLDEQVHRSGVRNKNLGLERSFHLKNANFLLSPLNDSSVKAIEFFQIPIWDTESMLPMGVR